MAALFPVRPGPGGGAAKGGWEGPQREEERARGLFLEGSQPAEAEEFREQSTPHAGSNLRLGSRLQLAGMGPAGTWDLPVPGQGKVLGGGQGCIPVPGIQVPAAGSRAFPAGFSLSLSVQRF